MKHMKSYAPRVLTVAVGVFIIGVAAGLFKLAAVGSDPFTAMNSGISAALEMQFGTLQLLVNAVILVLVFLFKRQFIGFGTIFNMVFVGYTADFLIWLMGRLGIVFSGLPIRIGMLLVGAVLICAGAALYISADMGMSPYDAAGYVVEVVTGGRLQFKFARPILDVVCVGIALLTGAQAGIQWEIIGFGTVFLTLCTGPLIQFFRTRWTDPFLRKLCPELAGAKAR